MTFLYACFFLIASILLKIDLRMILVYIVEILLRDQIMSTIRNSIIGVGVGIGAYALTQVFSNASVDDHCKDYLVEHNGDLKTYMQENNVTEYTATGWRPLSGGFECKFEQDEGGSIAYISNE